ncbi:MAG: hypothetical protein JKP98_15490 [Rhodobacteraceae bacterium]|nr:hypothetical protein [Paracoccaceae bacterium]
MDDIFTALEEGQPANQVDQLRMAYLIAQNGRDGLRAWGSEPSRILASASLHEQRAILLLDNGTTFFRILGEVQ